MQAARTVGIVEMAKLAGMVELASAMPIRTVVFFEIDVFIYVLFIFKNTLLIIYYFFTIIYISINIYIMLEINQKVSLKIFSNSYF